MGVKTYYQFHRGASLVSGLGAYKALVELDKGFNGKTPLRTKPWRKEIGPLFERLIAKFGRGSVGELTVIKTRNPRKFGLYMGKRLKKKKPDLRAVAPRLPAPGQRLAWNVPTWMQAQVAQVQQIPPRPAPTALDRAVEELEQARERQRAEMRAAENALLNLGLNIGPNDQGNRVQVNINGTGGWRR